LLLCLAFLFVIRFSKKKKSHSETSGWLFSIYPNLPNKKAAPVGYPTDAAKLNVLLNIIS
jgi:hypothetical protein